jgi:hypothetical protein
MTPINSARKGSPPRRKLKAQSLGRPLTVPGHRDGLRLRRKDRALRVFDVSNSVRPHRMPMIGNARTSREVIGAAHAPQSRAGGYIARELTALLGWRINRAGRPDQSRTRIS